MSEFSFFNLGEICKIETGKQIKRNHLTNKKTDKNLYPYFNGGKSCLGYYYIFNNLPTKVIISQGGESAGYVNLVEDNFFAGSHCYTLTNLDNKTNIKYLFYYLKNNQKNIQNLANSSTIKGIKKIDIFNLKIPLPSIEEQKRIVKLLDDLNYYIDEINKLNIIIINNYKTILFYILNIYIIFYIIKIVFLKCLNNRYLIDNIIKIVYNKKTTIRI